MIRSIFPASRFQGQVEVPKDKSISHRALILGALAQGQTRILGLLDSEDVQATWNCLAHLGVTIEKKQGCVFVEGSGNKKLKDPTVPLPCANSGTTLRLLSGVLAGQPITATLTGDPSLSRRPMRRIAEPLTKMGAFVQLSNHDTAPVTIRGKRPLSAIDYELPLPSAQVKSAILLAGLFAEGVTVLRGKVYSRDHTERMLPQFGAILEQVEMDSEPLLKITGGQPLTGTSIVVPGDFSSAAFWVAAATMIQGSEVLLKQVSLNPTRLGFLRTLISMGAQIEIQSTVSKSESMVSRSGSLASGPEPMGDLYIRSAELSAKEIDVSEIPLMIDELPLLGVVATQAKGTTVVRGAEELRKKESDRIEGLAKNLRAMGGRMEVFPDGFAIEGPTKLQGATIIPEGDHRLAMAFSIAALVAKGITTIHEAECVSVSYPNFYQDLQKLRYNQA